MSAAEAAASITEAEAERLFAEFRASPGLLIAVSGGPDSTALLFLLARWRGRGGERPPIQAATVDHGLRAESGREASEAARTAGRLGIPHSVLPWCGEKPRTRVQERARAARYTLLAREAERVGSRDIVTAHTIEDQAETVLLRLAAGSGIAGLGAIAPATRLRSGLRLARPLLAIPKTRLIVTCREAGLPFAEDPSNSSPAFARPRLRASAAVLAREGLTPAKLLRLAARARRAEAALSWAAERAAAELEARQGSTRIPLEAWRRWPDEIALRVLHDAVAAFASEGSVEQGKLERLFGALGEALGGEAGRASAARPWKRTLAGALIALDRDGIVVGRAPARRIAAPARQGPSPVRTKTAPLPLA